MFVYLHNTTYYTYVCVCQDNGDEYEQKYTSTRHIGTNTYIFMTLHVRYIIKYIVRLIK